MKCLTFRLSQNYHVNNQQCVNDKGSLLCSFARLHRDRLSLWESWSLRFGAEDGGAHGERVHRSGSRVATGTGRHHTHTLMCARTHTLHIYKVIVLNVLLWQGNIPTTPIHLTAVQGKQMCIWNIKNHKESEKRASQTPDHQTLTRNVHPEEANASRSASQRPVCQLKSYTD